MRSVRGWLWRFLVCFTVAVLSVSAARGADIAYYLGMWNPGWYGDQQFKDAEKAINETKGLFKDIVQFGDTKEDFTAFEKWVKDNMKDGELDIIWLNGCMPSVLYPYPNKQPDGSLAEDWLDNGNMFINVGDWFAYVSYECGSTCGPKNPKGCVGGRCPESGSTAAGNILNLSPAIITFADNSPMKATATAGKYMPTLQKEKNLITFRPVQIAEVKAPWEVVAIFASAGGSDDPKVEVRADPIVIHNTKTHGYVAIINQSANGIWIDRGTATAEFIKNWVPEKTVGWKALAVESRGKLTTTWGELKE